MSGHQESWHAALGLVDPVVVGGPTPSRDPSYRALEDNSPGHGRRRSRPPGARGPS